MSRRLKKSSIGRFVAVTFETLEPRMLLSRTFTFHGREIPVPSWVPDAQIPVLNAIAPAPRAELVVDDSGGGTMRGDAIPHDAQARPLIGGDAFFADPQYAGIRGQGTGQQPFSIAIIDSGIDLDDPAFGPDLTGPNGVPDGVSDRIVARRNFIANPPNEDVDAYFAAHYHGTLVTSIAAGFQGDLILGMAPAANIIMLKVLDPETNNATSADIAQAVQWVLDNAAQYNIVAVNISISDQGFYTSATSNPTDPADDLSEQYAALAGMQVTVASTASNNYCTNQSALGVAYPGADPNVLSVGATWDETGNYAPDFYGWEGGQNAQGQNVPCALEYASVTDRPVPSSQRHPTVMDVFAPGGYITGASSGTGLKSAGGTSYAAPFVTGAVALAQHLAMQQTGQRLSFTQIASLLRSTGVTVNDNYTGPDIVGNPLNVNNPNGIVPSNQTYKRLNMLALANQIVAPKVSGVKIGSSSGAVQHADYTVPVGSGDQLKTIPVGSPNEIMITFTEAVDVVKGDLSVVGAASGTTYSVTGSTFNYDTNSKTAKWTFASAFPPDQLVVTLDDGVTDFAVNANGLDGEWANPASLAATGSDTFPSGNGTAGGDFIFRITILPGDVTRNNIVDLNDLNTVNNNWLLTPATWIQGDQSGDNLVNQTDKNFVLNNFGRNYTSWPGGGSMMMMSGGGGGESEIGEEAARQALLDYYSFRLANPKSGDPFAGLLGSTVLGNANWWDELLGEGWEQLL